MRQLYKLILYAKQVRKDCGVPMAGELKVTDITKLLTVINASAAVTLLEERPEKI